MARTPMARLPGRVELVLESLTKNLIAEIIRVVNDILHMSFLAGTRVFKAYPACTTTEI